MSSLVELISPAAIDQRVRGLAREIDAAYAGQPLVAICVLKGAFLFYADLVRQLTIEPELDFVRLASYGSEKSSSGKVFFTKDVETEVEGKHVLLVEDIVDTGRSMEYLVKVFEKRGAASVAICAMLDKSERREQQVKVDFVGFPLKKGFVVGYGLDYAERYRQLPGIYEVVE